MDLNESPTRYGNFGLLKFLNTPSEVGVESIVAKYAYVPLGNSGVTQNLPLWISRTPSSVELFQVKSSTKYSGGKTLVGGLFCFNSILYPDLSCTIDPPDFSAYP